MNTTLNTTLSTFLSKHLQTFNNKLNLIGGTMAFFFEKVTRPRNIYLYGPLGYKFKKKKGLCLPNSYILNVQSLNMPSIWCFPSSAQRRNYRNNQWTKLRLRKVNVGDFMLNNSLILILKVPKVLIPSPSALY